MLQGPNINDFRSAPLVLSFSSSGFTQVALECFRQQTIVSFRVDYFLKCSIRKADRPNFLLIQGLYISYIR